MFPLMTTTSTVSITVSHSVSPKFLAGNLVRAPGDTGVLHEISPRYARTGTLGILISKGYVWHQIREIVDSRLSNPLLP